MTSSFSISKHFGVSVSLMRFPSNKNLSEFTDTPCESNAIEQGRIGRNDVRMVEEGWKQRISLSEQDG